MDKPVFRLDERLYPDDKLIPTETRWTRRGDFYSSIEKQATEYYASALGSIDAALPLLCLGHIGQSYLLLFHALEILMKGFIDDFQRQDLKHWMGRNPELARKLAQNSLNIECENINDLTFLGAFHAISPIVGFSPESSRYLKEINKLRNDIVHRKPDKQKDPRYLQLILEEIFPLLDSFFLKTQKLDLADYILHPIARELIVISKYFRRSRYSRESFDNCIRHFRTVYFYEWNQHDTSIPRFDDRGLSYFDDCSDEYLEWKKKCGSTLNFDIIGNHYPGFNGTTCRICNKDCFVTTNFYQTSESDVSFQTMEVKCPYCHLNIDDPLLAEIHYGQINRMNLGDDSWRVLFGDDDFGDS